MQKIITTKFSKYLCAGLISSLSCSLAVDFPQWRGPNRDGIVAVAAPAQWPEKLKQNWKITVGEGHSSPVVSGNRVFQFARQGEREVIAAYDLASGKKIWEHGYATPYEMNSAATGHGKGPKATPVLGGGRICANGITGTLTCLDASTGKVAWSHPNLGDALFGTASSPVIDGGLLITQTGKQDNGTVTAFNLTDGTRKWSYKSEGAAYSSPVIATFGGQKQVVVEAQSSLASLSVTTGELLWKIPISTPYDQNSVTALAVKDLLIYSGLSNPVIAVRPSGKTAAKVWENKEGGMYMNSPVLAAGLLHGLTHRNKGQFFSIDPMTGKTIWTGEGRQAENAAMLAAGNIVYALTTNSELLIFEASTKGLRELKRYTVADSPTWAHPAIVDNGRFLIKDKTTLALWSAQ